MSDVQWANMMNTPQAYAGALASICLLFGHDWVCLIGFTSGSMLRCCLFFRLAAVMLLGSSSDE
jgi:hypothetical protein